MEKVKFRVDGHFIYVEIPKPEMIKEITFGRGGNIPKHLFRPKTAERRILEYCAQEIANGYITMHSVELDADGILLTVRFRDRSRIQIAEFEFGYYIESGQT